MEMAVTRQTHAEMTVPVARATREDTEAYFIAMAVQQTAKTQLQRIASLGTLIRIALGDDATLLRAKVRRELRVSHGLVFP